MSNVRSQSDFNLALRLALAELNVPIHRNTIRAISAKVVKYLKEMDSTEKFYQVSSKPALQQAS